MLEGSKYVMLYSVGDFVQYNYKLGAAYSDVLIPRPHEKPKRYDSANVWKTPAPAHEVVYRLRLPPIFDHGSVNLRWNLRFLVPCSGGQRAAPL